MTLPNPHGSPDYRPQQSQQWNGYSQLGPPSPGYGYPAQVVKPKGTGLGKFCNVVAVLTTAIWLAIFACVKADGLDAVLDQAGSDVLVVLLGAIAFVIMAVIASALSVIVGLVYVMSGDERRRNAGFKVWIYQIPPLICFYLAMYGLSEWGPSTVQSV